MGLDGIEIILEIEKEFQIAITDEEAFHCRTPDQLTSIVYSRLRKSSADNCPSQHGFYKVRKALIEECAIPRKLILPSTPLDEIIPVKRRPVYWNKLLALLANGRTIHATLQRPKWLNVAIYFILPLCSLPFFLHMTYFEPSISVLSSLATIPILLLLTLFFKNTFPSNFREVKDLIPIVGTLTAKVWNREEVYERVRGIVSKQLGIKEGDILPDSDFVKDLGLS